jgi:hypothetical protein
MLKKYKIVESEFGGLTLHTRNNLFVVALFLSPLVIANVIALVLTKIDLLMLLLWLFSTITLLGFALTPYRYTKYFSTPEELHEYIAEERLKSKPETYYLDD